MLSQLKLRSECIRATGRVDPPAAALGRWCLHLRGPLPCWGSVAMWPGQNQDVDLEAAVQLAGQGSKEGSPSQQRQKQEEEGQKGQKEGCQEEQKEEARKEISRSVNQFKLEPEQQHIQLELQVFQLQPSRSGGRKKGREHIVCRSGTRGRPPLEEAKEVLTWAERLRSLRLLYLLTSEAHLPRVSQTQCKGLQCYESQLKWPSIVG